MVSLIIIIVVSILVGVLFFVSSEEMNTLLFFVFSFAAFGVLISIRYIVTNIVKILNKKKTPEKEPVGHD